MKKMLHLLAGLLVCAVATATGQPVPNMPPTGASNQPINVTLGWRALTSVSAYEVEYGTDPDFEDVEGLIGEDSEIEVKNLAYATSYYWHVRGLDASGEPATDWSAAQTFKTKSDRGIAQPISPADGETEVPTTVPLVWSVVEGATGYEVEYANDPEFVSGAAVTVSTSGTTHTLSGLENETTIFWRVRSTTAGAGPAEWSRYVSFTTEYRKPDPLLAPRLLAPANGSEGHTKEVNFSWGDVPGEKVNYTLEVALDKNFDSLTLTSYAQDSTGAIFSTLESGMLYYWRAKAANDETESPWSETWTFRAAEDTVVGLIAPELLTPIDKAAELPVDLLLTWDSVEGAIFYEIEVGRDGAFDKVDTVLVVDSTSVEIAGLIEGTAYFWRARAGVSAAMSAWSKPFAFSTETAEEKLPEAPILLSPENGSKDLEGAITLSWSSAQFAAQYFVQLSATGSFDGDEEQYTQITEDLTIDELKPGVQYFWRVQGVNQYGESAWSDTWSFVVKGEKLPETPILLTPANGSKDLEGAITLSWSSAQFAAQYFVQLSATGSFDGDEEQYTEITENLTIDDLKPGVQYFWRVQGVNQFGESAWSDTWSFVVKEEALGVESEEILAGKLRLYPVPATDVIYIDLDSEVTGDIKVEFVNSLGTSILTQDVDETFSASHPFAISLDGIPSGILYCRIHTEKGTITRPVVVIR